MRVLPPALVATSSATLALRPAAAAIPTSYIDIHQVTSFTSTGAVKSGFLFRIEASESDFGGSPPRGPKWASHAPLTSGVGSDPDEVGGKVTNRRSPHPSHRLALPPDSDPFLCNEAGGVSNYKNPAGNSAVFDPTTLLSGLEGTYVLVPRGRCTFEAKARSAQRLGAAGVIVRSTLDFRYRLNWPVERRDYECGTRAAANHFGWRAEIEASKLSFDPSPDAASPYDGGKNDPVLTGSAAEGNLCAIQPVADSFPKHCPTERCLLTGRNASDDGSVVEACCAWDTYVRMSTDGDNDGDAVPQGDEEDVTIPALFVTMEGGDELYDLVVSADANSNNGETLQFLSVVAYARWYPSAHYSAALLWALAVFALWVSAYESAGEYRASWRKISQAVSDGVLVFQRTASNSDAGNAPGRERAETEDTVDENDEFIDFNFSPETETTDQSDSAVASAVGDDRPHNEAPATPMESDFSISDDNEDDFVGSPAPGSNGDSIGNEGSSFAPPEEQQPPPAPAPADNLAPSTPRREPQMVNLQSSLGVAHNMEINVVPAIIFGGMASIFLLLLFSFFFDINKVFRALYGLGGSVAVTKIILYPLCEKISSKYFKSLRSSACVLRGSQLKWIDVVSHATGLSLGVAWIAVGLTRVQPMDSAYYWIFQDVMGVCFCVLVLGMVRINSIMFASILLCLFFVYDVFYALISPHSFGGTSVVAGAASGSSGDASYCEKYPSDRQCRGILAPLPMLLAIPWFNDFRGGFAAIRLGDIVLPGLLISFAARFDAARRLVKRCSRVGGAQGGEDEGGAPGVESDAGRRFYLGRFQSAVFSGYFGPLVIAYAAGLSAAYAVVSSSGRGQPALLFLVPACLGATLFLGWRRRELSELWSGPRAMRKANRMVNVAGRIPEARAPMAGGQTEDLGPAETSTIV